MTVDELVDKLAKPTYVFRMQKALHGPQGNGTRKARREIEQIVKEYVQESGIMTPDQKGFAKFLGEAYEG